VTVFWFLSVPCARTYLFFLRLHMSAILPAPFPAPLFLPDIALTNFLLRSAIYCPPQPNFIFLLLPAFPCRTSILESFPALLYVYLIRPLVDPGDLCLTLCRLSPSLGGFTSLSPSSNRRHTIPFAGVDHTIYPTPFPLPHLFTSKLFTAHDRPLSHFFFVHLSFPCRHHASPPLLFRFRPHVDASPRSFFVSLFFYVLVHFYLHFTTRFLSDLDLGPVRSLLPASVAHRP